MNKTVKTIAWICLVLGLLGVTAEVGAYVYGRSLVAQVQESIESGEFQTFKKRLGDVDDDGDIDEHDREEWPSDKKEWFKTGAKIGYKKGSGAFSKGHGGFHGIRGGNFGRIGLAIPFLLLASGPVLTVVGAVILIVNREPKVSDSKEKKEKGKKK